MYVHETHALLKHWYVYAFGIMYSSKSMIYIYKLWSAIPLYGTKPQSPHANCNDPKILSQLKILKRWF